MSTQINKKRPKQFTVTLTAKEWGKVCRALMENEKELHNKIYDALPYLK